MSARGEMIRPGNPLLSHLARDSDLPRPVNEALAAYVTASVDLWEARADYLVTKSIGADEHRRRARFLSAQDAWVRASEKLSHACLSHS